MLFFVVVEVSAVSKYLLYRILMIGFMFVRPTSIKADHMSCYLTGDSVA